jgi:putative colanic acid biosynthesis UDP-glucose lipid carrier transferase
MYDAAPTRDDVAISFAYENDTSPAGPTAAVRARVAESARKRALDLVAAGFALILLLPFLALIALAIRLESKGPALFRQRRTGLNGRVFSIYKFRTMTVVEDGGTIRHAEKADSRVTALGRVLRKYSIDELPQLLNVLQGHMSLVGPRPHAVAHDTYYGSLLPTYGRRFRARPGLTGLAQVSGRRGEIRSLNCMAQRVLDDNAYIEGWSFRKDLAILLQTLPRLLNDPSAY